MEELKKAIDKMVSGASQIIVNPDTFNEMVKLGLPISYAEPLSIEEYISRLFERKKKERGVRHN